MPLFVVGFLAAIAVRSTDVLSADVLSLAKQVQVLLLEARRCLVWDAVSRSPSCARLAGARWSSGWSPGSW